LIAIPGIGPFSAELFSLRGAGDPDFTPTAADIAEISEDWKPFRT
jgi:3-methyladenine DNA glycosylase/8-oxoguanine DNA glycosylase